MVEGAWVWGVRGGEWSVMRGDDGGGEDGGERIEVVVWHRERLDVHGEVGELSVKRGDVGGKEEVVERSEEEVECEGEFLVVCVGELRVMRGDVMGGEEAVERLEESADSVGEGRGGGGGEVVWEVGKSGKSEKENGETCVLGGFGVVSASVRREKGGGVWWRSGPGGWFC